MENAKFFKGNVKMIAHRGFSGKEKENTMSAFVAAGNRSYFGIETDVHKTLDGEFVIIHDNSTGRVAIDDMVIEKSTFDTLRNLLLTDMDGKKGRTDLRIPTLKEYIQICKKYNKKSVLELKNEFTEDEILKIISIIQSVGYLDNVIFISFSLNNLQRVRKLLPNQKAQYLVSDYSNNLIDTLKNNKLDLDIVYNKLTKDIVDKMHSEKIEVNCWTCDDPSEGNKLVSFGVDYITTNILE